MPSQKTILRISNGTPIDIKLTKSENDANTTGAKFHDTSLFPRESKFLVLTITDIKLASIVTLTIDFVMPDKKPVKIVATINQLDAIEPPPGLKNSVKFESEFVELGDNVSVGYMIDYKNIVITGDNKRFKLLQSIPLDGGTQSNHFIIVEA